MNDFNTTRDGVEIKIVETGQIFNSIKACADYLGVSPSAVSRVVSGDSITCRGCHIVPANGTAPIYYVPETEKFPIQLVQDRIEAFNRVYDWKYRKIYEAMKIKYEPLENYRRNEKITETYTPNLTTEDTKIASFSDISKSSNNRNETASSSATIGANTSNTAATYGNETTTNEAVITKTTLNRSNSSALKLVKIESE